MQRQVKQVGSAQQNTNNNLAVVRCVRSCIVRPLGYAPEPLGMEPRGMDWRGQLEGNQFREMKRDLRFTD